MKNLRIGMITVVLFLAMLVSTLTAANAPDGNAKKKSGIDPTAAMQMLERKESAIEKWAKIKTRKGTKKHARKRAAVSKVIDSLLDYEFIAGYVLGKYWDEASEKDRNNFLEKLRELLNDFYLEDAFYNKSYEKKYLERGVEELYIRGVPKSVYITSEIQVMMNKKPVIYEFIYHLHKKKKSYRVIDLEVDSVSLIRNYRDEFRPVLKKNGLDGLITRIEEKVKKKDSKDARKKPAEKK